MVDFHLNKSEFTTALIDLFSNTRRKHDLLFNILLASSIANNPLIQCVDLTRINAELDNLDKLDNQKIKELLAD